MVLHDADILALITSARAPSEVQNIIVADWPGRSKIEIRAMLERMDPTETSTQPPAYILIAPGEWIGRSRWPIPLRMSYFSWGVEELERRLLEGSMADRGMVRLSDDMPNRPESEIGANRWDGTIPGRMKFGERKLSRISKCRRHSRQSGHEHDPRQHNPEVTARQRHAPAYILSAIST